MVVARGATRCSYIGAELTSILQRYQALQHRSTALDHIVVDDSRIDGEDGVLGVG